MAAFQSRIAAHIASMTSQTAFACRRQRARIGTRRSAGSGRRRL